MFTSGMLLAGRGCGGGARVGEGSVPSAEFSCEPKTALKSLYEKKGRIVCGAHNPFSTEVRGTSLAKMDWSRGTGRFLVTVAWRLPSHNRAAALPCVDRGP